MKNVKKQNKKKEKNKLIINTLILVNAILKLLTMILTLFEKISNKD